MWELLTNCAATQWQLGLATWQQCKKRDREGKGREGGPAWVWGFDDLGLYFPCPFIYILELHDI